MPETKAAGKPIAGVGGRGGARRFWGLRRNFEEGVSGL